MHEGEIHGVSQFMPKGNLFPRFNLLTLGALVQRELRRSGEGL